MRLKKAGTVPFAVRLLRVSLPTSSHENDFLSKSCAAAHDDFSYCTFDDSSLSKV